MIKDICTNIETAAKLIENIEYTVVLRGDSTLRGHFPEVRIVDTSQKYFFWKIIISEDGKIKFWVFLGTLLGRSCKK